MTKRVIITGGNKGIGLEAVRLFVEQGCQVISIARKRSDHLVLRSPAVQQIEFDLTRIAQIPDLVQQIGPVDILVNNAGMMTGLGMDAYSPDLQTQVLRLNLEAPVTLMHEVSKAMKVAHSGRIVNNASIAGQIGHPDVWYGITKAGLINATKSFAKLLGSCGIQVNAIAVSPVETDMLQFIPQARKESFLATTSEKRFAQPEEVAQTMFWLALEAPSYLNGACIDLNSASYLR